MMVRVGIEMVRVGVEMVRIGIKMVMVGELTYNILKIHCYKR